MHMDMYDMYDEGGGVPEYEGGGWRGLAGWGLHPQRSGQAGARTTAVRVAAGADGGKGTGVTPAP